MSTQLFEEALADAKKLKEVAEENAKKAILESVTPRIREFIESQLLEQDEDAEISDKEMKIIDELKDELASAFKNEPGGDLESLQKALKAADFTKVINNHMPMPRAGFKDPKAAKMVVKAMDHDHLRKMGLEPAAATKVSNAVKKGEQDPSAALNTLGKVLGMVDFLGILEKQIGMPRVGFKKGNESSASSMDEEIVLDENAIASLIEMLGGEGTINSLSENKKIFNESVRQTLEGFSSSKREKILRLADKINESADKLSAKNINNNESIQENDEMSKEKFYEVDLQALREEIEKEMEDMTMEDVDAADEGESPELSEYMYEEETDEMDDMLAEIKLMLDLGEDIEEDQLPEELRGMLMPEDDMDDPDLEMADEDSEEESEEDSEEESEDMDMMGGEGQMEDPMATPEDLNEVFEIDPRMLQQELNRVKRLVREGKMDHHFGGKGGGNAGVDGAYGGKGKKGAFGGGSEGQDAFTNPPQINKLNEAIRQLRRQNRAQTEKLTKYRSAVQTLREQLEDLNLFNAKLLYVNKLLQNKGLTESQKKSVIKALDEARSLGETKTLYKSLTESLASKKPLNESARYGSSSRTTTSSSGRNLNEAVSEMSRWQRLAGLEK